MKQILTGVVIIMVLLTFFACQPKSSNQNANSSNAMEDVSKAKVGNPLGSDENNPKPIVTIPNPNTRKIQTKPRPAAEIAADKKLVEEGAEEILKYMVKNGRDMTLEEIGKGKSGAFGSYIQSIHNYFSLNEIINGTLTIVGHTVPAYVGFELDSNQFADLSGWLYWKATEEKIGVSNRIWTTNVYWNDVQWANGAECTMDNYTRVFKFDGNEYWYYNNVWTTQ